MAAKYTTLIASKRQTGGKILTLTPIPHDRADSSSGGHWMTKQPNA
jgi:hypothetical protein